MLVQNDAYSRFPKGQINRVGSLVEARLESWHTVQHVVPKSPEPHLNPVGQKFATVPLWQALATLDGVLL